jgi:phage-related protein
MPRTKVVFFRDADGAVPVLDWLDALTKKALDKCRVRIGRLQELGHELRRPEADFLRDGIYELRIRLRRINYRILYFFHDDIAAVVSHGITKEKTIPAKEIDRAVDRKRLFAIDPTAHTYEEA